MLATILDLLKRGKFAIRNRKTGRYWCVFKRLGENHLLLTPIKYWDEQNRGIKIHHKDLVLFDEGE